jgi:predicted transcriptional regulator
MIHNKYFEIIEQFLKGYNKEIYGRELVKRVKISQKNIALTLKELEEEGILSSKIKGNLKYYFLNRQNSLVKKYLILTEIWKSARFLEKNPKINQLFEKFDKLNNIFCIFGSYAKNIEKKDSDLDLFIIGNADEKEIQEVADTYNINISIKKGKKPDFIDLLKKNNPLMNEILENHIIISGYEEFVEGVVKQKWQI